MRHDRFTHSSLMSRLGRNLAYGARNPSLLVHNLLYKTSRGFRLLMLIAFLLSMLLIYTSLSNGCYLSFEADDFFGTVDIVCDVNLYKETFMRKYHFIIFFGGYANHTYLDSWTINHNLNLSFYTDTEPYDFTNEKGIHVIGANNYILSHRPHMKESLRNLTWIEKADYLRYLAVATEGGIYSDIDVVLTMDIRMWLHSFGFTLDISELDFVFGIEFDRKTKSHNAEFDEEAGREALVEIPFQLTQWCFTGAQNSYMLMQVVKGLEKKFKEHPNKSENQDDVMRKTGPLIFTKIILKEISQYTTPFGLDEDGFPHSLLHHSNYENFRNNGKMIEMNVDGRIIRGVILPRRAFGDYSYGSLIKHSFYGSWKGKSGKIKQREIIRH